MEERNLIPENQYNKSWGQEYWFANNSKYCGKVLTVEKGQWSSNRAFHYHEIKDETFFVIEGELILDWVDEHDQINSITLLKDQSFRVRPTVKHRFTARTEKCVFIEVSTTHSDEDSYRVVFKNGSWQEYKPNGGGRLSA